MLPVSICCSSLTDQGRTFFLLASVFSTQMLLDLIIRSDEGQHFRAFQIICNMQYLLPKIPKYKNLGPKTRIPKQHHHTTNQQKQLPKTPPSPPSRVPCTSIRIASATQLSASQPPRSSLLPPRPPSQPPASPSSSFSTPNLDPHRHGPTIQPTFLLYPSDSSPL